MTMSGQNVKRAESAWPERVKVILLFVTLEVAVLSVEWARWISPQPYLTLVLVGSVLAGWLLARSRLPGWLTHILALSAGAAVTLLQGCYLLSAPPRFEGLMAAFRSWWQAGGAAPEAVMITFGVFLTVLTWLIGYVATWYLVRKGNPWVGAALGAVVVLVNLSNLPGSYYPFFVAYFLAGALLVAWCRLSARTWPAGRDRPDTRRVMKYTGVSLLCLAVLAGALAWEVPEPRVSGLQTALAAQMLWKRDIEDSRLNVFASVPAKQPIDVAATHDELEFGPVWHESDRVSFIVDSPHPAYWRVHIYDVYGAAGWSDSEVSDSVLEKNTAWGNAGAPHEEMVTYNVTAEVKTNFLLMAGEFVAADTPVLVHTGGGDIVGITVPRVLNPGESYSVTSDFVSPSPGELAAVEGNYPPDIQAYYLQLPPGFPVDIRQLASRLTRRADTPYEKVQAIHDYLSGLTYSTKIDEPPEGVDAVEHFLFGQKSGFCLYFASAMAVMLRSVDVPARLAVGYLPGEPGEKTGEYIIRDKHYHAWVQVYFPGYGWVDLEATPGGSAAQGQVAIETPWVSPDAIEHSAAWNAWQWLLPYGPWPGQSAVYVSTPPASGKVTSPVLPFAATLGRILLAIIGGLIFLAVALVPWLALRRSFYRWLWHVDRDNLAATAYARMAALAGMAGIGPKPYQTPLEFAAALGTAFPQEAADAGRVAQAYADSRFGGRRGSPGLFEEAEVLKARCQVYRRLLARAGVLAKFKVMGRTKRIEEYYNKEAENDGIYWTDREADFRERLLPAGALHR